MSTPISSTPIFFETKYRQDLDPWGFAQSEYEKGRFDTIIAALTHRRYRHATEPGCSVGVLTERLAEICDLVDSSDFSPTAVERAKRRCEHLNNVRVSCASFSEETEVENADLVVLSEIGYYFSYPAWMQLTSNLVTRLSSRTTLLAVHWTGSSIDHQISGDSVHEVLHKSPDLFLEYSETRESFRLDRWTRR